MVKHGIQIYARVRPAKKAIGSYEVGETEESVPTISFIVPKSEAAGFINNKKEVYLFRFNRVFEQDAHQEDVFNHVARGTIDNCLEGYNGTLFAYGQTGSGKTFTITGGASRYIDRGIIPRTLSYIFKYFQESPEKIFTVHVSYLEIYNEHGYDLLDPRHEASKLEDLPKVSLMEASDGNVHLKNLSLQPAVNEEEALNWLFLGDTNRMIAETPMNMASTRSHCIFTVYLTVREPGSDVIKKSKLHLVDLAGSERIGKTGVAGTLLTEAKCINLSLHFLEQVIVALSEKSRNHIPYRNSMMTSVLRDSLGGNCMTSMIATCSVEKGSIDESISTCRFAQRVALIKNDAMLNEELDPKLMVARLKQQVHELKEELAMATGGERTDDLSQEDLEWCKQQVDGYIAARREDARLSVGGDLRKINYCFKLLKMRVLELLKTPQRSPVQDRPVVASGGGVEERESPLVRTDAELDKMKSLLKQRDDEINILVKMLKQEKRRAAEAEAALARRSVGSVSGGPGSLPLAGGGGGRTADSGIQSDTSVRGSESSAVASSLDSRESSADGTSSSITSQKRAALRAELSKARQEAFDTFRRDYTDNDAIEQQKRTLKAKYAEAKSLGERVNSSRMMINQVKTQIEKIRVSRAVSGLMAGSSPEGDTDEREEELRQKMEEEKAKFKSLYHLLKDMKSEIEHRQHLLEKAKVQLQKDFETWWEKEASRIREKSSRPHSSRRPSSKQSALPSATDPLHPPPSPSPHYSTAPSTSSTDPVMTSVLRLHHSSPNAASSGNRTTVLAQYGGGGGASVMTGSHSYSGSSHPGTRLHSVDNVMKPVKHLHTSTPTANTSSSGATPTGSIPLTGDRKADADILAFYKARQKLIERGLKRAS